MSLFLFHLLLGWGFKGPTSHFIRLAAVSKFSLQQQDLIEETTPSRTHTHLDLSHDLLEAKPSLMNNKQSDSMGSAFWGIPGFAGAGDDSKPVRGKKKKKAEAAL